MFDILGMIILLNCGKYYLCLKYYESFFLVLLFGVY